MSKEKTRTPVEDFAADTSKGELVPAAVYMPPAERHGALKVEVYRNGGQVRRELTEIAAMLGERGYYRWPVKNKRKGTTDWVEGVSIKGANALVKAYKNCRVSCPVIVDLGSHWRMHAVFVDWESGTEWERSFMQRKSGGTMGDNVERQQDMAYQIGISKAERNVILNALEVEAEFLLEECKGSIVTKIGNDIERYRKGVIERIAGRNVELARVEVVVGRPAKDWLAPDIARVIAMMSAIADGMATVDETFPSIEKQADERAMVGAKLDEFTSGPGSPTTPAGPDAGAASPRAAPAPIRKEAVDKILACATDKQLSIEDRLANLDGLTPIWQERLAEHPGFCKALFKTAVEVATGEMSTSDARKYLEQVP